MSLRIFHVVFVLVSILLSVFVTLWGIREYSQHGGATALVLAIVFALSAVVLVIYGRKTFRKLKELS